MINSFTGQHSKVPVVLASLMLLLACLELPSAVAQDSLQVKHRDGFTLKAAIGVANQGNIREEVSNSGLAGPNIGVGAFQNPKLAVIVRLSLSTAKHYSDWWTSGVIAPTLQYWLSDQFNVEAGAGYGFYRSDLQSSGGMGLLLGFGLSVYQKGKTCVLLGLEVTPVFTNADPKYEKFTLNYWSLALNLGIQLL